jgi:RHS repeat-associated protein
MQYDRAVGGCQTCSGGGGSQPTRTVFPTFEQEYGYDLRSRKTLETDIPATGQSRTTGFAYDPAGNLIEKTDKDGNITVYEYDALNRLIGVTDPLTGTTSYEYDGRDNLIALTDAQGNTTRFEYDRNNRLTREIRPMDQQTVYAYDAAGNLTEKTDAKNQKTAYAYDAAGRLVHIEYFTATDHTTPQKTVAFTYDASGNLTGYDDGVTSAAYGYDAASRKIAETVDFGPFSKTNAYTYYPNNRKQSFTGPDGLTYTYYYDAADQFTGVNLPGAGFVGVNEYQWTRPLSMTYPGGMTRSFDYDPLMRATRITSLNPGDPSGQSPIQDYQYNYDKMDNIVSKQTEHGDYGYGYDALYRLTAAAPPAGTGLSAEAFTYDGVGNRLTSADTAGPWAYNANNELTGHDEISYAYDANGNMVQKIINGNVTSFVYNTEDRLARVWSGEAGTGDLIAEYYYDPFGRRLWKQVGATRIYYHYSDDGLIAEYDAAGNEIKAYGWKLDAPWSTDPLFMKQAGQYYFYHNDHLGTPQKLTDLSGAVVWSAKYESFGKAAVETATVENNLRFPGQYFDAETGLHYNLNRYYLSGTGRYVSADPIGFQGGANFYSYVENNPANFSDMWGLTVWKCKRPFDGQPGEPYPPFFHHQYVCVTDGKGGKICGSTTPTVKEYFKGVPARPSTDKDGDYYHPKACKEIKTPEQWYPSCAEKCIIKEIQNPSRPEFAIRPGADDCHEWTDDTIEKCIQDCAYIPRPSIPYAH